MDQSYVGLLNIAVVQNEGDVSIISGENAGEYIKYENIVRKFVQINCNQIKNGQISIKNPDFERSLFEIHCLIPSTRESLDFSQSNGLDFRNLFTALIFFPSFFIKEKSRSLRGLSGLFIKLLQGRLKPLRLLHLYPSPRLHHMGDLLLKTFTFIPMRKLLCRHGYIQESAKWFPTIRNFINQ